MTITFTIGAPSLSGKGAQADAEFIIDGMAFPCVLHVANRMPRAAVFPESGIELASAFAGTGHRAAVTFASAAVLRRLLRCASEVAELNGYAQALTISDAPALSIDDEALTQQIVEAHPGLRHAIEAAGGVDAVATLVSTDAVVVARDTNCSDVPDDHPGTAPVDEARPVSTEAVDPHARSADARADGGVSAAGAAPARMIETPALPKAVGKKFKHSSGASQ